MRDAKFYPQCLEKGTRSEQALKLALAEAYIQDVSVVLSEREVHWRTLLQSLLSRGLCGVRLVVSDAHGGITAGTRAVLGGVPWQRRQFHLQQNASRYVPKQELKAPVAADIRAIFTAQEHGEGVNSCLI